MAKEWCMALLYGLRCKSKYFLSYLQKKQRYFFLWLSLALVFVAEWGVRVLILARYNSAIICFNTNFHELIINYALEWT